MEERQMRHRRATDIHVDRWQAGAAYTCKHLWMGERRYRWMDVWEMHRWMDIRS